MFACDTWSYVVDEASMLPMSSPARRATVRAMSESVTFRYVCVWRPRCSRCDTSYPRTMACPPYSSYSASRAVTSPVTSGLVAASPSARALDDDLAADLAPVAASTLRSDSRKASTNMAGIGGGRPPARTPARPRPRLTGACRRWTPRPGWNGRRWPSSDQPRGFVERGHQDGRTERDARRVIDAVERREGAPQRGVPILAPGDGVQ